MANEVRLSAGMSIRGLNINEVSSITQDLSGSEYAGIAQIIPMTTWTKINTGSADSINWIYIKNAEPFSSSVVIGVGALPTHSFATLDAGECLVMPLSQSVIPWAYAVTSISESLALSSSMTIHVIACKTLNTNASAFSSSIL